MGNVISEFGRLVLGVGRDIQCTVMPDYTSVDPGIIVQYTGATDANYINGYFYKCTNNGWERTDVQDVSDKANKVASATTDDLASLTATGDLADSGKKLSDLVLKTDVKDVLNSTSTTDPLSANMGHTLGEEVNAIVNVYASKNLLPNKGYTQVVNGATFTWNKDRSITINGTFTTSTRAYVLLSDSYSDPDIEWLKRLNGKSVILSKEVSNAGVGLILTTERSDYSAVQNILCANSASEVSATLDLTNVVYYNCCLFVDYTTTFDNVTVKPMLRDARIVDGTYEPSVPTNRELMSYKTNGIVGSKNLFPPILSGVDRGVTFTVNADKSVTVNGSPSGAYAYRGSDITDIVKIGQTYKVTGGHAVGKYIVISASDANWVFVRDICVDNGDGATFSPDFSDYVHLYMSIIILNGQTCTNEVFYPMLRPADDTDETYQPFAMTNKMLTDAVYEKFIPAENISFTAYADGVKTLSTLVDDVMTQLQIWINNNPNKAFQFNYLFLQGVSCRPTDSLIRDAVTILGFTQIGVGLPNFYMRYIVAQSSGSQVYLANGTFTATDESSGIAGDNVVLYIIAYKKT